MAGQGPKDGMASYEFKAHTLSGAQIDVGATVGSDEIEADSITSAKISPQAMQWGVGSVVTGSSWTTYGVAFTTAPTSVQVTGYDIGSNMDFAVAAIGAGSFQTIGSSYAQGDGDATGSFSWVAFGTTPA